MAFNISTKLLQAFFALEECRHFTRAAERCHMSQSAFSDTILRLEDAVGVRLFERTTRNVVLTPEGEVFSDVARRLAADIEAGFSELAAYVALRNGRVAVAALPSLAAGWLPPIIAQYRRRYPGISIALFDALSDPCLDLLRQGRADFALTAPSSNLAEFETRTLYSDAFFLVCHCSHPLARKPRVEHEDLAGCELIDFTRSTSVRQHVDLITHSISVVHTGFELEHIATVAGLVAAGLGVTIVPQLTLFHFQRAELAIIPLNTPKVRRPILVVQRKGHRLSIAAQRMLELVEASAANMRDELSRNVSLDAQTRPPGI